MSYTVVVANISLNMSHDNHCSFASDYESITSEGGEETRPSLCHIAPYQFEPLDDRENDDISNTRVATTNLRVGKTDWCHCGHCRPMVSEEESVCCLEYMSEEFTNATCITLSNNFGSVCLHAEVLKATLGGLNSLRGDNTDHSNRSMRYAGYRIFTWWIHGRLGRGVRKVIPSCAIWAIRDKYPEENNVYKAFQEANDEIHASCR